MNDIHGDVLGRFIEAPSVWISPWSNKFNGDSSMSSSPAWANLKVIFL